MPRKIMSALAAVLFCGVLGAAVALGAAGVSANSLASHFQEPTGLPVPANLLVSPAAQAPVNLPVPQSVVAVPRDESAAELAALQEADTGCALPVAKADPNLSRLYWESERFIADQGEWIANPEPTVGSDGVLRWFVHPGYEAVTTKACVTGDDGSAGVATLLPLYDPYGLGTTQWWMEQPGDGTIMWVVIEAAQKPAQKGAPWGVLSRM